MNRSALVVLFYIIFIFAYPLCYSINHLELNISNETNQLLLAYKKGELNMVKDLIEKGAIVNVSDIMGNTPLHFASDYGRLFFPLGKNESRQSYSNNLILNYQIAKLLISKGANINTKNSKSRTPLYLSTHEFNQIEILKLLVDKGADVNLKDNKGNPPIYSAFYNGNNNAVEYLLLHGSTNSDEYNNLNIHYASETASIYLLDSILSSNSNLVNIPNKLGQTPLHIAIVFGKNIKTVKYLIDHGANVNAKDIEGVYPIEYVLNRNEDLYDIIQLLIKYKSKLNPNYSTVDNGGSILTRACQKGDLETIKYCLDNGFNMNYIYGYYIHYSLLYFAILSGNSDVVKYLIKQGINYNYINDRGWSALDFATEFKKKDIEFYLKSLNVIRGTNKTSLSY